jgi:hypothetical protein
MLALRTALSNFADALVLSNNKPLVTQARNAAQAFAASNDATNPFFAEYVDLYDLAAQASARGLAASQAAALQTAVVNAVVAERHVSGGLVIGPTTYNWSHSRARGLSIYYPVDATSSAFSSYVGETLYQMTRVDGTGQEGTWDEFLDWALAGTGGPGGHGRGMNASRSELKLPASTNAFVTLPVYLPLIRK